MTDAVTVASQNDWDPVRNRIGAVSARQHRDGSSCRRCFCAGDVTAAVRGRDVRLIFRLVNGIVDD